jgi:hypothetical protein
MLSKPVFGPRPDCNLWVSRQLSHRVSLRSVGIWRVGSRATGGASKPKATIRDGLGLLTWEKDTFALLAPAIDRLM